MVLKLSYQQRLATCLWINNITIMRKKLTILAVILTVIAVYSGFWYMQGQRFKESVSILLNDAATELHVMDMEFIYGDLRVSGFPFSHQVYVHQARFMGSSGFAYDVASHQPLIISMGLFADSFSINIPQHIEVIGHEGEKSKAYQLLFYTSPLLKIDMDYDHYFTRLLNFWTDDEAENHAFYINDARLESFELSSDAFSVMAVADGQKILQSKQLYLNYEEDEIAEKLFEIEFEWLIEGVESERFLNITGSDNEPFGVLHSKGSVELKLPESAELLEADDYYATELYVEHATLQTPRFELSLAGDLQMTSEWANSEVPLALKIVNYEKAVEYVAAFYNEYIALDDKENKRWSDKARVKRALKKLASEQLDDGKSLILLVEPSVEGEAGVVNIGDYTMQEVQKVWETGHGELRKRIPTSEAQTVALPSKEDKEQMQPVEASPQPEELAPAFVPSQQIKKQLKQEKEQDVENDTIYEYPDPSRRRR